MVKNSGTKQLGQRTLGDGWQWKANGQCSKGDNCSFRHDMIKRAKTTQPNPSPSSSTWQNERSASRNKKSERQKSQWKNVSIAVQGLPQRNSYNSILWKESGILQIACSTSPRMDAGLVKSALMRIARLMNSRRKGLKRMVTKVQWLC